MKKGFYLLLCGLLLTGCGVATEKEQVQNYHIKCLKNALCAEQML